ncbi:MAG: hypothetical protein IT467_11685 [Dokdonella sp.]|nr:hypothetical protein [Dokdonella sp.]
MNGAPDQREKNRRTRPQQGPLSRALCFMGVHNHVLLLASTHPGVSVPEPAKPITTLVAMTD